MMNALEKVKLTRLLDSKVNERNNAKNALQKVKLANEVQELRRQLGLIGGRNAPETALAENEVEPDSINTDLNAYREESDDSYLPAVNRALKHLQGKYVNTVIGKVLFNAVSSGKLAFNTKADEVRAKIIPFVPKTLASGEYLGRTELYKARKDNLIAFHQFKGEVVLDELKIKHIVKVAERASGEFEFLAYYSNYERGNDLHNSVGQLPPNTTNVDSTIATSDTVSAIKGGRSESVISYTQNDTTILDSVQDNLEWGIEILEITDLNGEPVSLDDEVQKSNMSETPKEYADTVVLNSDGNFLLVQRALNDAFKPGKWWIPGGHIEANETAIEAAKRELKEETGIQAKSLQFLEKAALPNGGISHRFVCLNESDSVTLQKSELNDYAWVSIEQLNGYDLVGGLSELTTLVEQGIELVKAENVADDLNKTLALPENPSKSDLSKAVSQWLKENAQGKVVVTSDGKKVVFNRRKSIDHLAYDGRRSELAAKSIPYVLDVFSQGRFIRREELNKVRDDGFIAFHCYQKKVQIDDKIVLLEAKAGEKENGELEALEPLIAYHQKILTMDNTNDKGHFLLSIKSMDLNGELAPLIASDSFQSVGNAINDSIQAGKFTSDTEYTTPIFDSVQPENALLTILAVTDLEGNPISFGEETVSEPESNSQTIDKSLLFNYNPEGSTAAKRQRANNKAMAIVKELWAGEISMDSLTNEQKITLSEYSGSGGGLTDYKGDKGSQYEYYTPKSIAAGMWDLLKESGFSGGKVLDPCAGTGIFAATAPDNLLMENVELDRVSGTINQAVFGGETHKTTIAPFEEVASSTPDEQFDAVITNVPFGDNSDRGGNQVKDSQYQDEALDSYFILRSLKKLKPNGLAVFMCSTRIMSGANFRKQRVAMSEMAEFIGAYRLPNKVFNNANADVITDVLLFKKHSTETKNRIDEVLKEDSKGRELLAQANVLWQPFIDGRYFKAYPQNVLGTETQVKGKYGLQEAIESNADIADIAKMMRKFEGSRIDWDLLQSQEGELITYQNGDTTYFDGVLRAYENGKWVNVETAQTKETIVELIQQKLKRFSSPLQIIEEKQPLEELLDVMKTIQERQISLQYLPNWLRELLRMAK